MSVLENFKNIPRSPYGGRQGSNVIFFFKFATKSLEKKKERACRPPNGRQDPVAHPRGDRVLISLCHLSLKIQEKERGEEKKSGEAMPNSALVIYR